MPTFVAMAIPSCGARTRSKYSSDVMHPNVTGVRHNPSMTSSFGWYAVDPEQRRRMIEAVDQFRDTATIDDLGMGGIRDTFSDVLFPGTSTLHTRLRYVLFIPWLMQAAMHGGSATAMQLSMRDNEYTLIDALRRGGETEGVIGRTAGRQLRRLPSVVYWGGLQSWGIIESGLSTRSCFERAVLRREQRTHEISSEDGDAQPELVSLGIDTLLPDPPDRLLGSVDFDVRPEEADYLGETITRKHPRSLFAHLLANRPPTWTDDASRPEAPWSPEIRDGLTAELDATVDLAHRFSRAVLGANLLYNLLLAESSTGDDRAELVTTYRESIAEWRDEQSPADGLSDADRRSVVDLVATHNRRTTGATKGFLDDWCSRSLSVADPAADTELRDLVRGRERSVKGERARLGNQRALDAWNGASGTQLMMFRWNVGRSHLQDLYDAKEVS